MKKIFYILASAIVALGAVACDNQDLDSINPNAKGEGLTINATINTTKVVFDELTATSWEEGDFVTIGDFTFDYIADEDVFRCDDAESMNLVGQTLPATANALNSAAGIKGSTFTAAAQEIKEGVNFVFDLSSALLKYTATAANATLEGTALSANVNIVCDGTTKYVAVKANEEVSVSCMINGIEFKTITTTFEAGKIYNLGSIEVEPETLETIDKNSNYLFKKATSFVPGKWYAIVANGTKAASALTSNYGYLQITEPISANGDIISLPASCAFGFRSAKAGYTIQQYDNKYVYQTGTYNSFNVQASCPTNGSQIWSVSIADGVATITNKSVSKTVSYDSGYNSYGSYSSATVKPSLYELVEVDNTPHIVSVSKTAIAFSASGGEDTVNVTTMGEATLNATADAEWLTVSVANNVVTVIAAENKDAARTATITITYGDEDKTVNVSQSEAGVVIVNGKADFETIKSTNTSYVSGTTTAGWSYTNCAILSGGTNNSSPKFTMIGDASNRALCMNGKTSAKGTITSPTLTTGCGTLTFNYGLPFSDTKIKFQVDIIQNGTVVKTFTINNTSATKLTKYTHEEVINIAGNFSIKFSNLSPSNSTSNKDRTAIWDVEWTGYAE